MRVLVRVAPVVLILVFFGFYLQPKLAADCPVCACSADQPVCDDDGDCVCPDVSCDCGAPYCDPTYGSSCHSEPSCDCGAYCDEDGNWQCDTGCDTGGGGCDENDCSCDQSCVCDECDVFCADLKPGFHHMAIPSCCYEQDGCGIQ